MGKAKKIWAKVADPPIRPTKRAKTILGDDGSGLRAFAPDLT